jgi:ATP-independent RNA helicase DbpA
MTNAKSPAGFADLALSPSLLQVVQELGFETLTPIQARSIPHLLRGADVIGQSSTGSGKTAAFALPILERLRLPGRRLQALILCPTRELCAQVAREVRRLGRRHAGLQVLVVSGGMPSGPQRAALEKGVHVVVGTPGRVLDLIGRDRLDLTKLSCVVLDEADRMLDMGFRDDMEAILKATPPTRQTVFFSATFPESIDEMSRAHQRRPLRVTIGEDAAPTPSIRQLLCETRREDKPEILQALLRKLAPQSALVFCNQKATVDELTAAFAEGGISAAALHGGLEQKDRDRVMAKFRNHSVRVLLATDVAARGLDVESLDAVFNFDLPGKPDVYVHRIGRTGRAGRNGIAISLVTPADRNRIAAIEEALGVELDRQDAASSLRRLAPASPTAAAPASAAPAAAAAAMATLYIAGGRKDKLRPGDILGALTGEAAGLDAAQIGKIEIHDDFAYVAVAKSAVQTALRGLRDGRIKGRKFQVELVR